MADGKWQMAEMANGVACIWRLMSSYVVQDHKLSVLWGDGFTSRRTWCWKWLRHGGLAIMKRFHARFKSVDACWARMMFERTVPGKLFQHSRFGSPATFLKNVSLTYYTRNRTQKTSAKSHILDSAWNWGYTRNGLAFQCIMRGISGG